MISAAFYCVADACFFLGAVGLVNSLRLVGHDEPVFLLDCGLTAEQRRLLSPHVELVADAGDGPPALRKMIAPLRHPAEVMVLIDVDMVAQRRLDPLIATASEGRIVAMANDRDRWVPEWGSLLGLGPARRRVYVNSGLVALGGPLGREVLQLMHDLRHHVEFQRTLWSSYDKDYPFVYGDQDLLNAILATRVPEDRIVTLPHRLAPTPPFECLHPDDPYVLHHFFFKPWLERTPSNVYTRRLTRCLLGPDLAVRLDPLAVPLRLRIGPRAAAARLAVRILAVAADRVRQVTGTQPLLRARSPGGAHGEEDAPTAATVASR